MSETCATCRYWRTNPYRKGNPTHEECHRNAPQPGADRDLRRREWPITGDDDWCGEHQPREVEPEKPKAREPGYYWTRDEGHDWVVREWSGDRWFSPGSHVPRMKDPDLVSEDPCLYPMGL